MSSFRLDHKVAIVTGGASGIGKSIVEKFVANGAYVHILDKNEQAALDVVKQFSGNQVEAHFCEVSSQQDVLAVVDQIHEQHRVHILVNNAGVGFVGNLEQTPESDFDRLCAVNIKGVYNLMYACIPRMKEAGGGVILNMASIVSSVGIPDRFAYSMTKGAVLTMTYSVALDYIRRGIRCNSISPARVHTPFVDDYLAKNYPGKEAEMYEVLSKTQPLGRMARPEEIANLALFLCSDEAAFITGCDYPIDGGFIKLVP